MKPIIGVMPLWDDEKESIWMLPGYMEGIQHAGGIPVVLSFSTDEAEIKRLAGLCDGFLFTGGHDISPKLYHEEPMDGLISCCEVRDRMEMAYLHEAISTNKPVLGICHQRPPYDVPIHEVMIAKASPLYCRLEKEKLSVNSYHHQAIKTLAYGLKVMGEAPDGLIEAVYMPGHRFLWAVQWHPEYSWKTDENSVMIFKAFIEAAKKSP